VSVRGALSVTGVEWSKLAAQLKVRVAVVACAAGPFVFAAAIRVQGSLPTDTLFGRSLADSGLAVPLVVLGFSALWAFPVLASIVGGDVFSAEDRYGTWTTMLTRSRSRAEVFGGKVLAALCFSTLAVATLAASSVAAGVLVIGRQPVIDLSGILRQPREALFRVMLAWMSVLPPTFGFTGLAVLTSIATRHTAAGIGLPVIAGLLMQLAALIDGPEAIRRLLITSAFETWHGFLTEPPYYGPLAGGTIVSGVYLLTCLAIAYRVLRQRDIR
jgi:ABC-2 type transport system permease protein